MMTADKEPDHGLPVETIGPLDGATGTGGVPVDVLLPIAEDGQCSNLPCGKKAVDPDDGHCWVYLRGFCCLVCAVMGYRRALATAQAEVRTLRQQAAEHALEQARVWGESDEEIERLKGELVDARAELQTIESEHGRELRESVEEARLEGIREGGY